MGQHLSRDDDQAQTSSAQREAFAAAQRHWRGVALRELRVPRPGAKEEDVPVLVDGESERQADVRVMRACGVGPTEECPSWQEVVRNARNLLRGRFRVVRAAVEEARAELAAIGEPFEDSVQAAVDKSVVALNEARMRKLGQLWNADSPFAAWSQQRAREWLPDPFPEDLESVAFHRAVWSEECQRSCPWFTNRAGLIAYTRYGHEDDGEQEQRFVLRNLLDNDQLVHKFEPPLHPQGFLFDGGVLCGISHPVQANAVLYCVFDLRKEQGSWQEVNFDLAPEAIKAGMPPDLVPKLWAHVISVASQDTIGRSQITVQAHLPSDAEVPDGQALSFLFVLWLDLDTCLIEVVHVLPNFELKVNSAVASLVLSEVDRASIDLCRDDRFSVRCVVPTGRALLVQARYSNYPARVNAGVLLCFDCAAGKVAWAATLEELLGVQTVLMQGNNTLLGLDMDCSATMAQVSAEHTTMAVGFVFNPALDCSPGEAKSERVSHFYEEASRVVRTITDDRRERICLRLPPERMIADDFYEPLSGFSLHGEKPEVPLTVLETLQCALAADHLDNDAGCVVNGRELRTRHVDLRPKENCALL
ncbi:unnamed protein product [Durusdinium trenchii]|uniref:Uncharacterized protein n=1 Tax=Durusdinium trenchii TaxID=1381693 RepID=A0ABP0J1Z6_9DINO